MMSLCAMLQIPISKAGVWVVMSLCAMLQIPISMGGVRAVGYLLRFLIQQGSNPSEAQDLASVLVRVSPTEICVCVCSVNFTYILVCCLFNLILFYIVSFLVQYYVVFSTFHFQYSKLTLIL